MNDRTATLARAKQVYLRIASNRGEPVDRIRLSVRLNYDLGLDGDDVDELLESIQARRPIDWTDFQYQRYFSNEGIGLFAAFALFLLPIRLLIVLVVAALHGLGIAPVVMARIHDVFSFRSGKAPFPVALLVWAAASGRFEDPPGNLTSIEADLDAWSARFAERFRRRRRKRR